MKPFIIGYLLIINLYGIIIMGVDKRKAQKREWRIREKNLWLVALVGGAPGSTIGMLFFRHKTQHLSFKIGFPLLAILEIVFCYILLGPMS
ncbi:DUF1294 domain-containing protein [Bacillus niameyensis]|uniref:DUF1294 domain-containing protein n=1 Tax=Bacillus niameyensis TaxID=1522308 RepID=UPI000785EE26|nr:DUF1294 domain-containing protein [Bacillus niameyensis]